MKIESMPEFDIKALQLKPGDVISIQVKAPITIEQAERLRCAIKNFFPDNACIIQPAFIDIEIQKKERKNER
jgi:hypothetical protein